MESIFANFFADVNTICGHEKTFHANFMHHAFASGLSKESVVREFKFNTKRVDVVLFADRCRQEWLVHREPRIAIEFKGGAYNVRNALRDTIDADGNCEDLDKLLALKERGLECWFVCIDVAELGIALSTGARQRVAMQCARRGINFAYFAQNEGKFMLARDGQIQYHPTPPLSTSCELPSARWNACLPQLASLLRRPLASEDTYTGMVYHALKCAGLGSHQISLETYFNCAKGSHQMQKRPDMCIFNGKVGGRFNLYKGGDVHRSNDGMKIGNLQALIEVKGSSATERLSDRAFAKLIAEDIEKLAGWRDCFRASGYLPTITADQQPDYVMIAIDNRQARMSDAALSPLQFNAQEQDIQFHYLSPAL